MNLTPLCPERTVSPDACVFIPVARACAFADAHQLPRQLPVINDYRRRLFWPPLFLIGPGALDPLPAGPVAALPPIFHANQGTPKCRRRPYDPPLS